MDFKAAVAFLGQGVTSQEIAEEIGCSVPAVNKARGDKADRPPPPGWQRALARIADRRGGALAEFAVGMREQANTEAGGT